MIGVSTEDIGILLDSPIGLKPPPKSTRKYEAYTSVPTATLDIAYRYNVQFPAGMISLFGCDRSVTKVCAPCMVSGSTTVLTDSDDKLLTGSIPSWYVSAILPVTE